MSSQLKYRWIFRSQFPREAANSAPDWWVANLHGIQIDGIQADPSESVIENNYGRHGPVRWYTNFRIKHGDFP